MPARRCPLCSLVNPGSAMSCDCGYSFVPGVAGKPLRIDRSGSHHPMSYGQRLGASIFVRIVVGAAVGIVFALARYVLFKPH
ncbi:MAG TPA: hypothetical protein VL326_24570 [Kofleriaceae bacterium]|nr:hypothetical protein [Kofleriaceae bacterium]